MDGGFQDDGASGTGHGGGGAEAFGVAGGVDDPIIGGGGESGGGELRLDAGSGGDGQLFGMAAELMDWVAVGVEDHGDEQAEFAIAQNGDGLACGNGHLVEDLTGGGEGFEEDGAVGGDVVGEYVEIALGKGEEFGEGSGVVDDSQDGAVWAVASEAFAAPFAVRAGQVDFAGDALAGEGWSIGFDHFGDEFVAGSSGEAVVAALQFEIGIADAGHEEAEEGEPLGAGRDGQGAGGDCAILQMNCEHALYNRASCLRN